MKRLLLLILLLGCAPAGAQDFVQIIKTKYSRSFLKGHCRVDCNYPEVHGREDLNVQLRKLIPPPVKPDELIDNDEVHIEEDFVVTLNGKGLLSVAGHGLMTHLRNGRINEAHPTKLFGGMTLDLKTGKAYSLRDLFGPDARAHLDPLVYKAVAREMGGDEAGPMPGGSTYRCVLTTRGVTFYQIFDNFAAGSVEVTLPYEELREVIPAGSPLSRFLK